MELDEFQEAARLNMDEKVLLVAPPGSGKTTVLLAKIDYLMAEVGVKAEEILVLTFSRSASQNLKSRFSKGREATPQFGTIHSFAWRELAKGEGRIRLIESQAALRALSPVRRKFHLSPEEVAAALSDISRQRSTGLEDPALPETFRREVRKAYFSFKAEAGLKDFDDLEEELLQRLEADSYRKALQSRFRWILVDEFQDLNPVQLKILKILSMQAHLFCVGDEDQCIYAFRGSDTEAMIRFPEEFPGGRILYLKYNYRSSATVIRHANALIRHNKARYPKVIVNFRQEETQVEFRVFPDETRSLGAVAEELPGLARGESCALIFRTNQELTEAARGLCRAGLRFTIQDQVHDRYRSGLYRPFLLHLRYARASGGDKGLFLDLTAAAGRRLPEEIRLDLAASPVLTERDLLDHMSFDLPLAQKEELATFFRDIRKLRAMKPGPAIRYVLYVMGVCHVLRERAARTGESLSELLAEIEALAREAAEFPSTADFLRYLDNWHAIMDRRDPDSPVILSTMHGVKGMEYDRVYVMNAAEGLIPHERSFHDLEAERRLFYVALTRARHHLIVHGLTGWQGRPVAVSRFLKESGARLPDEAAAGPGRRKEPAGLARMGQRLRRLIRLEGFFPLD